MIKIWTQFCNKKSQMFPFKVLRTAGFTDCINIFCQHNYYLSCITLNMSMCYLCIQAPLNQTWGSIVCLICILAPLLDVNTWFCLFIYSSVNRWFHWTHLSAKVQTVKWSPSSPEETVSRWPSPTGRSMSSGPLSIGCMKWIVRCVELNDEHKGVYSVRGHLILLCSGGGSARGHVLDRASSFAVVTDGAAAGADGLRAAGDQRGGAEEGGALQRGGWAAAASAVVLADPGWFLQWGEGALYALRLGTLTTARQHCWHFTEVSDHEGGPGENLHALMDVNEAHNTQMWSKLYCWQWGERQKWCTKSYLQP